MHWITAGRRCVAWFCLVASGAGVPFAAAGETETRNEAPALMPLSDVLALSGEQLAAEVPVRTRGIVTLAADAVVIQEGDRAIWVVWPLPHDDGRIPGDPLPVSAPVLMRELGRGSHGSRPCVPAVVFSSAVTPPRAACSTSTCGAKKIRRWPSAIPGPAACRNSSTATAKRSRSPRLASSSHSQPALERSIGSSVNEAEPRSAEWPRRAVDYGPSSASGMTATPSGRRYARGPVLTTAMSITSSPRSRRSQSGTWPTSVTRERPTWPSSRSPAGHSIRGSKS
jgi:hypothetical protein